ncbi:MAG: MFS transporter [Candidatus Thorarchaeota archaeon]
MSGKKGREKYITESIKVHVEIIPELSGDNDMAEDTPSEIRISSIERRNWFLIFILGMSGQIAWAVENTWFNTFVFDTLTPDPQPIALMVAASAITATLTAYVIGAYSDRSKSKWGRRKPYIVFGYIFWGILTAIFPAVSLLQPIGFAIIMVVIADSVMTFFGSTANDAAFNAWVTDITDTTNRDRLQGVLSVTTLVANLVALGLAGFIIDNYGYFVFFYALGGFVTFTGLLSSIIKEEPVIEAIERKPIFQDMADSLRPKTIRENKTLYLLLGYLGFSGIAMQISAPYEFIYIEHFLGISKTMISVLGAIIIPIGVVISLIYASQSHKFNRKNILSAIPFIILVSSIGMYFVRDFFMLFLFFLPLTMIGMLSTITLFAWIQDNYPEGDIGKFQGIRLVFMVLLPMVIGPPIGAYIVQTFGIPTILNGIPGFIPTPEIFLFRGLVALAALIPLWFISKEDGVKHKLKVEEKVDQIEQE